MNKVKVVLFIIAISYTYYFSVNAQYILKNSTFSNGAVIATNSNDFNLNSTAGQTLIGSSSDNFFQAGAGLWSYSWSIISSIDNPFTNLPTKFELYQNYPNPFNPNTTIKFALPKTALVKIDVFNLLGQHVAIVLDSKKQAGYHIVHFDANLLASGLYFYTISTDHFHKVKKMMFVK